MTYSCSIQPMAYNEELAQRIRKALQGVPGVEEKKMFGGVCFMVNDKMCVGIVKDDLMARIDPERYATALKRKGCREMDFNGKPMKGFIYVSDEGMRTEKALQEWIEMALAYNQTAKAAPKRKKKA